MIIHLDYVPMNWNKYINEERTSFYLANKVKQLDRKMVRFFCKEKYSEGYPCEINFMVHYKDHRQDLDNFRMKGLIDGLVDNGIIEDDNLNHVQRITITPVFDKKECVEIEIRAI